MSNKVMTKVWDCQHITNRAELTILLAMADWSDDDGRCFPSIRQLARKTRLEKRSCIRVLQRLRNRYVKWKDNNGGRNVRNQYRIIIDALDSKTPPSVPIPKNGGPKPTRPPAKNNVAARPDTKQKEEFTAQKKGDPEHRKKGDLDDITSGQKGCPPVQIKGDTGSPAINHQYKPPYSYTNNINIPHSLSSTPRTRSERAKARPVKDVLDLSFLPPKDQIYSEDIRRQVQAYPPDCIDQAYIHILRGDHRGAVPVGSLIQLQGTYGHTQLIAALVYAKAEGDGRGGSLKFLRGIMERWKRHTSTSANTRPETRYWEPPKEVKPWE